MEKLTASVVAIAIDSPRSFMILGRSGGTNEAYASLRPCAQDIMTAIRIDDILVRRASHEGLAGDTARALPESGRKRSER
jgi:hypothetical protein